MTLLDELNAKLKKLKFKPGAVTEAYTKPVHTEVMSALNKLDWLRRENARLKKGLVVDEITDEPNKDAMKDTKAQDIPSEHKCPIRPVNRKVTELIWHCAATPEGREVSKATIDAWHKARWKSGLGYHYIVHLNGRIELGRPVEKNGVHVRGHNSRGTIGAVYIGGVTRDNKRAKDTRTPEQRASMLWLTKQLAAKHRLKKISGHNQYAAKACPSFHVPKDELGNIPGFRNGLRKFFSN